MKNKVLLYGANGYTGRLLAAHLHSLDWAKGKVVLGGRSEQVKTIATRLGLESRLFDLTRAAALPTHLSDIGLVINLTGHFASTQLALAEACIATGTHYADIAGEVPEMVRIHALHARAQAQGCMLMPGIGFGVVPTDIAAAKAADSLPGATDLQIVFLTEGGASQGTLRTVLSTIEQPGWITRDGQLRPALPAHDQLFVRDTKGRDVQAVYHPWRADLFTAQLSTGIGQIRTYAVLPGIIVRMMKGESLWIRDLLLRHLLRFLPEGPSDKALARGHTLVEAKATDPAGRQATVRIHGPEAYRFTVLCAAAVTRRVLNGQTKPGFVTPAWYKDLLDDMPGVSIQLT